MTIDEATKQITDILREVNRTSGAMITRVDADWRWHGRMAGHNEVMARVDITASHTPLWSKP